MSNSITIWDGSNWASHTNRLVAKFRLVGTGDSDILTEINANVERYSDVDIEIHPRVFGNEYKDTELSVMYRENSDVLVEIQPYGYDALEAEIEVKPHNRMWATYQLTQPSIVEKTLFPIMDSFTRSENSYSTINYGDSTSLVVGKDANDNYWSTYIKFDLSQENTSYIYTNARIRFYLASVPSDIEVYELYEDWLEDSITYLNSPAYYNNLLTDSYTYNTGSNYIEFDLTNKIIEWIINPHNNNGLLLKAKDTSSSNTILRAREHQLSPSIILSYYDPTIFSVGRSDIITEIDIEIAKDSDLDVEIEVGSTFTMEEVDVFIYARQPNIPVENDIEVEISATKDNPHAEITVGIREDFDLPIEIGVYDYGANSVDTEISITKDFVLAEISSIFRGNNDVETEISVTKDFVEVEITATVFNEIEVELTVEAIISNEVETEIAVSRSFALVEISPRVPDDSSVNTVIAVNKKEIDVEIEVKERNDIDAEIDVIQYSTVDVEITTHQPKIKIEITPRVFGEADKDSEIYIKWTDYKEVEIDARSTSQIEIEINTKVTNNVDVELTVSKPYIFVDIAPRVFGVNNMETIIQPRIIMVNNMDTIITVGGRKDAYGFVM